MMNFKFSDNLAKFLARNGIEGVVLHPYKDSVGIPTIGIGTTVYPNGNKVTMSDPAITLEQAYAYCTDHLTKNVLPYINNHVTVNLNQNQVDALGSLTYNIGAGGFVKSTVLTRINNGSTKELIADAWRMWNKAGGKVSDGLVYRREQELKLFNS